MASAQTIRRLISLLAAVLLASAPLPVRAQDYGAGASVTLETFYDELEGSGRWYRHARFGEVWQPDVDDADWRPYTRGRWAFTDDGGWTWISDEPWGWAVYHYGRWTLDDEWGWIWIPGFDWAPAWVAWRESDDYVGWAPLPPGSEFAPDRGLSLDEAFYDEPGFAPYWVFVGPAYLTSHLLTRYLVAPRTNREIISRSRPVTHYDIVGRRLFNFGLSPGHIERRTGRPVPTSRVTVTTDPGARSAFGGVTRNYRVYRPEQASRPGGDPRSARQPTPEFGNRGEGGRGGPQILPGVRPGRGQPTPRDAQASNPPQPPQQRRDPAPQVPPAPQTGQPAPVQRPPGDGRPGPAGRDTGNSDRLDQGRPQAPGQPAQPPAGSSPLPAPVPQVLPRPQGPRPQPQLQPAPKPDTARPPSPPSPQVLPRPQAPPPVQPRPQPQPPPPPPPPPPPQARPQQPPPQPPPGRPPQRPPDAQPPPGTQPQGKPQGEPK